MATVDHIAARREIALGRLSAAADTLAERHGLEQGGDFGPPVPVRDAAVREVYRLERLADLLESLTVVPSASSDAAPELTVAEIRDRIGGLSDRAALEALLEAERNGKARKTAIDAIEQRLAEVPEAEAEG